MNYDELQRDADEKSALVDRRLAEFLSRDPAVGNLHDATLYALGLDIEDRRLRGKRIRPVLCLQTCEALGGAAESAMPFACAIELAHNYALVHDDLQDGDRVRRERPSVWARYGMPHAVNIGDYIYTKTFLMLLEPGPAFESALALRHLRLIAETLDHTQIGQTLDINARSRREFTVGDYMAISREKTGYYLAAPILGGALAAGAYDSTLEALGRFGAHIGPLFQVIDDLIDLTEGKGRGEIGSDIREGKRSYLVAVAASRCDAAERERLFDILDLPREETTPAHVAEALALFEKYRALEAARTFSAGLYRQAMDCLAGLPPRLVEYLSVTFEGLTKRTR